MFLRDCKINSVSTTKTNVAAVKKKMEKKNYLINSIPVFIKLDSLGGRSLAHVFWSLGSDSRKRLCYPGACCCWRTRFVFSHTGRWYTAIFHLLLLFVRRPIYCEYRNENLSDNPEFSRLTLPRNERDHMLQCWLENSAIHNCCCYRSFSIY